MLTYDIKSNFLLFVSMYMRNIAKYKIHADGWLAKNKYLQHI